MATINGDAKSNNLVGTSANDTLNGYSGNDTLSGEAGIDILIGGKGDDIYIVDSTTDIITEYSGGGSHDLVKSSVNYALGDYLNDLTLTGTSAISGHGNSLSNFITGNNADNRLNGGYSLNGADGNDTLLGLGGDDELHTGNGNDLLDGGDGNDFLLALSGSDTLYGGSGNDTLLDNSSGSASSEDFLYGGDGNDFLDGSDGNNQLYGGVGNDTLINREGDEILDGGSGFDLVDYSWFSVGDSELTVNLATGTSRGYAGTDQLISIEGVLGSYGNDTIIGNTGNNLLYGGNPYDFEGEEGTGNDSISGGAGNDTLYGYGGNDTLSGGTGIDSLIGGAGNDTYVVNSITDKILEYSGGGAHDLVKSSVSYTLGDYLNDLILSGSAKNGTGNAYDNTITGNEAGNILTGGAGNDTIGGGGYESQLFGGNGNDRLSGYKSVLVGGEGNDTLIGSGDVTYIFNSPTEGSDIIIGFDKSSDNIYISASGFGGGLTAASTITSAQFYIGAAAYDSSDRIIYNNSTGSLFFDVDGKGGIEQVLFATLVGHSNLTNSNIGVIA